MRAHTQPVVRELQGHLCVCVCVCLYVRVCVCARVMSLVTTRKRAHTPFDILLGQSNMLGFGKIKGGEGSLENAVKEKKLYPYLVDDAATGLSVRTCGMCASWVAALVECDSSTMSG